MTDTNSQKLRIDFLSRLHPDNEVRARPLENHEPAYQLLNRSPSRILQEVFFFLNEPQRSRTSLLIVLSNSDAKLPKEFPSTFLRTLWPWRTLLELDIKLNGPELRYFTQFFDYFNSSRGLKKLTQINRACDKFPIVIWQVFSTLMTLESQRSEQVEYISNISCGCCWKDL